MNPDILGFDNDEDHLTAISPTHQTTLASTALVEDAEVFAIDTCLWLNIYKEEYNKKLATKILGVNTTETVTYYTTRPNALKKGHRVPLLREDPEIAEELKGEYLGTGLMIRCFYQLPHAATIIITYRMGTPSAEIISAIRLR
ncbi:uncharacterized protein BKA55DRAFT_541278 [Fusarium redolens]|uniref:Uncharacterized protein n=1 Tax=Fusarium redolens TaxID=48865 RepID=A0A9P9GUH6_FUSRE|nr:uncharacterized protein BKA55DRAFT_541278 [Fusarium redolens]KAH7244372.1 hypothetical protein BKA55DRAFT_541278 [Fusarium redolens]